MQHCDASQVFRLIDPVPGPRSLQSRRSRDCGKRPETRYIGTILIVASVRN